MEVKEVTKTEHQEALRNVLDEFRKPDSDTIGILARQLLTKRRGLEKIESILKEARAECALTEKNMMEQLLEKNVEMVRAEGHNFTIQEQLHPRVNKPDQEKLHEWLREQGLESLIKESVHPGTLKAEIRENWIKAGRGDDLPEFFKIGRVKSIAIRKAKAVEK